MKNKLFLIVLSLLLPVMLSAKPLQLPKPGVKDTCPVCGMFVAKYPDWVATVQYEKHSHHFDGAKDLFKYLLGMDKWAPNHKAADIKAIGVTDYYELQMIDAHDAFFVIGSDVLGPMGHELIPLASEEDAKEFIKDHKGKKILRFKDINKEILGKLDKGVS